jgi:hypothetical protein
MTTYTVHVYREMRIIFRDIEAASHREAAYIASDMPTEDGERVEDCEGFSHSAFVEAEGGDGPDERPVTLRADGGEIEPAPDSVSNRMRASWAEAALGVFIQHTGCDLEDSLGDLLGDLMHWSEQHNFDFDLALDRARGHFEAELLEELPPPPDADQRSAPTLLETLEQALAALNTAPRFAVPSLDTDSYRVAALCDRAIARAKGGAQ